MESIPEINLDTARATAKKASATLKSAGLLVAKKAERTKLVKVILPRAYAELGKAIVGDSPHKIEFAELFKAANELLAQRYRIQEEAAARPQANSLADKAMRVAAEATDLARTKAIDLQVYQAFVALGEAVYLQHGNASGPEQLVQRIANAVAKRERLDSETAAIEVESSGKWITPRRVAWGGGILLGLLLVAGIFNDVKNGTLGGGAGTNTDTSTQPEAEPPVQRSFWGPTQLAYKKRIDLCDNPDKYKNTEMKMEVEYLGGGIRQGGKLVSMNCTVYYGDGSFKMAFAIPKDVSQPRIEPGQYLWVTFVFSGSVDSPSRVTALTRK